MVGTTPFPELRSGLLDGDVQAVAIQHAGTIFFVTVPTGMQAVLLLPLEGQTEVDGPVSRKGRKRHSTWLEAET